VKHPKLAARLALYYYYKASRVGHPSAGGALLLLCTCWSIENWAPEIKVQLPLDAPDRWTALAVLCDLEPETALRELVLEMERLCPAYGLAEPYVVMTDWPLTAEEYALEVLLCDSD
jgi:hypothetical protein